MIAVANGLGKTIEMIDPVKLLAVQKVATFSSFSPPNHFFRFEPVQKLQPILNSIEPFIAERLCRRSPVYHHHLSLQSLRRIPIPTVNTKQGT